MKVVSAACTRKTRSYNAQYLQNTHIIYSSTHLKGRYWSHYVPGTTLEAARHRKHHHTESRDHPQITGVSGSTETDSHVSDPRHCAFSVPHRAPWVVCGLAPGRCRYLELLFSPPWLYGALPETFLPFSISLYFLPAQRGCGGGERVGACFKVWFCIRFGPGSRVEQNATLRFQRFCLKRKETFLWMIMKSELSGWIWCQTRRDLRWSSVWEWPVREGVQWNAEDNGADCSGIRIELQRLKLYFSALYSEGYKSKGRTRKRAQMHYWLEIVFEACSLPDDSQKIILSGMLSHYLQWLIFGICKHALFLHTRSM